MSRTRDDWLKQRGLLLEARASIHEACEALDEFMPWGGRSGEDNALRSAFEMLDCAESHVNMLIGYSIFKSEKEE